MTKLKSVAKSGLPRGTTEVYSVSTETSQVKMSEIIIANKDMTNSANVAIKVYKANINVTVTVIPSITLLALESNFIPTSTYLTTNDKIIVETNIDGKIDVLISCIEV